MKTLISRSSWKAFSNAAKIPDDGWINVYLSDDELNQLRLLILQDLQVTEDDYHFNYSRLQPVILVTATTLLYLGKNVVFVEDQLAKAAKKKHLSLESLGTIEEEIKAFEKFPIPDQVEALKYTVNNFKEHLSDYKHLVQYYVQDQDPGKVQDVILKATNRSKQFQKEYYETRNEEWIGKMVTMMKQQPTFFALGAAHLHGKLGLLHLLNQRGYTLTPGNAFE